jgi:DNA-binding response OmpR family regulator
MERISPMKRREPRTTLPSVARTAFSWNARKRQRLHLNMPEFLMLELLARGGVHTRFALMEAAYGAQIDMDEKVVDAHVASIERRFRGIDAAAKPIERISKVAYRLGKAV